MVKIECFLHDTFFTWQLFKKHILLDNTNGLRLLKSYNDVLDALVDKLKPIRRDRRETSINIHEIAAKQNEALAESVARINDDYYNKLPKMRKIVNQKVSVF